MKIMARRPPVNELVVMTLSPLEGMSRRWRGRVGSMDFSHFRASSICAWYFPESQLGTEAVVDPDIEEARGRSFAPGEHLCERASHGPAVYHH